MYSFKEYLLEYYENSTFKNEDEWYDYHDAIIDIRWDIEEDIAEEMINAKPGDTISWNVIPAPRLTKIWQDYGKTGIVRDRKGIEMIKNILINNIIKLNLTNALCGHDTYYPSDDWENRFNFSEDEMNKINLFKDDEYFKYDNFFTYNNKGLISDYGLPKLLELMPELYKAQDEIEILRVSDQILNVAHQRNDLAGFFVEGGTNTLNKISGEGNA